MPGFLVHVGAVVTCSHGGQAQPTVSCPRVLVGGQPVVTQPPPYTISGCPQPPPSAGPGPCVSGQWTVAALRVSAVGQPVVLSDSTGVCVPAGSLTVVTTQMRVKGM